jgi:hypothetical protein
MKLELEFYNVICDTKTFKINDIYADTEDFGEKYDRCINSSENYGCGNMQFTRWFNIQKGVLKKYRITEYEYNKICNKLESGLSFGNCGYCI